MPENTFRYRVLLVDDEVSLLQLGKKLLETQGYEVHCAEDGFKALATLKRALPDVIISDLRMPNMNGFEFLSVVRRRFPTIPVIVISGEFSGLSVPENVLADAFFPKGGYRAEALFGKICDLIGELPKRPKTNRQTRAAVWMSDDKSVTVVTCSECLRTFPAEDVHEGENETVCDFCSCKVHFEVLVDGRLPTPAAG